MRYKIEVNKLGLVCDIELVFTSADTEGTHYFKMIKPRKVTTKRFKWEPIKHKNTLQPVLEALEYLVGLEDSKDSMWRVKDA
jgi:hypothetical protein